jgi:Right handed beta helix region/Pectate lyase superfamily protein
MTIPPFWTIDVPPDTVPPAGAKDLQVANLEAAHQAAGAYTDAQVGPITPSAIVFGAPGAKSLVVRADGTVGYVDPLVVNVKAWGAVGNGVADDDVAMQAAIDAVGNAGGGQAAIPSGTFITGKLKTLKVRSNTELVGSGPGSILKLSAASTVSKMIEDETARTDVTIRNLTIDLSERSAEGIRLSRAGTTRVAIEGCKFVNQLSTNENALPINLQQVTWARVARNQFISTGTEKSRGVVAFNKVEHLLIADNSFDGLYNPIQIDNATAACAHVLVRGNRIKNHGRYGIRLVGTQHAVVSGNMLQANFYGGEPANDPAAIIVMSGARYVTVTGNSVNEAGELSAYESSDVTISNNDVYKSSGAGIEVNSNETVLPPTKALRCAVVGNRVRSCGGHGVFVSGGSITVANNTCAENGGDGVHVSAGTYRFKVVGNTCVANGQTTANSAGVRVGYSGDATGSTDGLITNNTCYDDGAEKKQAYGVLCEHAGNKRIRILDNELIGNLTEMVKVVLGTEGIVFEGWGSGAPEAGGIAVPPGSVWHRTDGGAATCLYVKEKETTSAGWVGK